MISLIPQGLRSRSDSKFGGLVIADPINYKTLNPHKDGGTAFAYNQVGEDYLAYADGNEADLFDFTGLHAFGDKQLWKQLDTALLRLRETGANKVNILDAGCGPGTWLRRLVIRAQELGFTTINARGFDIAKEQLKRARFLSKDLQAYPGVNLRFDTSDLTQSLPEADDSIDIAICLYCVLNHLPVSALETVVKEFSRVTRGVFMTTVRPLGSPPTVFVDSIEKVSFFQNHPEVDCLEVKLNDGQSYMLDVHLFSVAELKAWFADYFVVTNMVGLDLFHSRFAIDTRWAPHVTYKEDMFSEHLQRLEDIYATDPDFIEHAAHLLLVGTKRLAS